jgi:hypothetical protein
LKKRASFSRFNPDIRRLVKGGRVFALPTGLGTPSLKARTTYHVISDWLIPVGAVHETSAVSLASVATVAVAVCAWGNLFPVLAVRKVAAGPVPTAFVAAILKV